MTISSPNFTRLQDGIQRADDLRVRGPLNVALAWLSGGLVTQLNTHFGNVSQSISVALASFLATANTFTAAQTIQTTAAGTALTLRSTDAGAGIGPGLFMRRQSATPAANDVLASIQFNGNNSAGASTDYALIFAQIIDPVDSTEDGRLFVRTKRAGADTDWYFESGTFRYSTQTLPSNAGEIAAVAYKVGANQVVSSRVTGYGDPFGAVSRATYSTTTVTTASLAAFVAGMYTDLKAHGLIGT